MPRSDETLIRVTCIDGAHYVCLQDLTYLLDEVVEELESPEAIDFDAECACTTRVAYLALRSQLTELARSY